MKTVILVDDDLKVINGLIEHVKWENIGIKVMGSANNGHEALELIKQSEPDILITDIYMPKMDGLELIEKTRSEFPQINIIIHSGYDDFNNARHAMKYGVQYFLLKPSIIPEIEKVLVDLVKEIEAEEKNRSLLKRYNEQIYDYLPQIRDSFLREILQGKVSQFVNLESKMNVLGIPYNQKLIVISISMIRSPYLTRAREEEWQLMKFGAHNIMKEIIKENFFVDGESFQLIDYSDSTTLLLFFSNEQTEDLEQESIKVVEEIMEHMLLILKLSTFSGVGRVKDSIVNLLQSFVESQEALEFAEYHELNQIYKFQDIQSEDFLQPFMYPFDLMKEMYELIHRKEYDSVLDCWERLEKYLQNDRYSTAVIAQNVSVNIISVLMMQEGTNENSGKQSMSELTHTIYNFDHHKQLITWLREYIVTWCHEQKVELTGKRTNKLIYEVKKYVNEYYDQEITLTEIADQLFVNKNYLSQLFKRITGETFVTYLNHFRIEKAKEKISENNYLIYEISEMVGYQNPTYFSQVFKSITGVSPSEYVNNHLYQT